MSGIAVDWETLEKTEVIPGFVGRVAHSDSMTFALWDISAGAKLPEHSHGPEQVAYVLAGEFEIIIEGKARRLTAGMLGAIPANARHSGLAITDCKILDVFSPIREDYRHGLTSSVISGKN